jgi:hypothetical protein
VRTLAEDENIADVWCGFCQRKVFVDRCRQLPVVNG